MAGAIVIKGARVHNLKNIDLEIPRDRLVVITGVSGSGKSSLAFDTLYAEGQRRYLESLGSDARQLLQRIEQPDVDSIEGLSPTIAVQQRPGLANLRSTVGTLSDVNDYLRLLFARAGDVLCIACGRPLKIHTIEQIVDELLLLPRHARLAILAPVRLSGSEQPREKLREYVRRGFTRALVDGRMRELADEPVLDSTTQLNVVVDRLALRDGIAARLADSLETAARHGGQMIQVVVFGEDGDAPARELRFSLKPVCPHCGTVMPDITPGLFSFNSPEGACAGCNGLGTVAKTPGRARGERSEIAAALPCPECAGARLRKESRAVRIGGRHIGEISALPLSAVLEFFSGSPFGDERRVIGDRLREQIQRRLRVLTDLGLGYLSLDRPTITLSGGEMQRVRLATQIGAGLSGVLYVLDEPSLGLHQSDNAELLKVLKRLRDSGNSVVIVEHDVEAMLAADHLIDMGPGAGAHGGEVIAQGSPAEIAANERSVTGRYLSGAAVIPIAAARRRAGGHLVLRDVSARNLKNLTVSLPLGAMTCVTGVSGAGKSTLVMDVLYPAITERLKRVRSARPTAAVSGWETLARAIAVDQQPIGRTPRSNAATYTGIYDPLRELFAQLPESRVRGYGSERFSFNVAGGRCEACAGEGITRIDMQFLPELAVVCPVCHGRRYNRETLEIKYKGLSIAEVLELTVDRALEVFSNIPAIHDRLRALCQVGLGYLQIGQPAPRLAGGEAQRVKLARELARRSTGNTLYVLDEPTAGLHFEDVKLLLELLHRLIDGGNTVVIVEHNLDVIKNADYVLDLGPGGGPAGGEVIAQGTPEAIAAVPASVTGQYLRRFLRGGSEARQKQ